MLSFKKFIIESNLAPAELYKYDWRVELFLSKFKEGKPLTLKTGAEIVLQYNADQESAIRSKTNPGKILFIGLDKNTYKLGDFAKTAEFGGGGGSGAGAALTQTTESAQAIFAQARWMGQTEYTEEDLETAYKHADTDEELSAILNDLPKNWRKSCIVAAEKLYKEFGSKQYVFHRGSSWVKKLEETFKKLNKVENKFANINKWSPADIYMVSSVGASINFAEATNIQELNDMLKVAIDKKDVIGISLKLLKNDAKLTYYNMSADKPIVKFDNYTTGTKGFFRAKDIYIYFTLNGKIQFRTFPSTFQGEIKGKNANNGKLSYGPIQSILKSIAKRQLTDTSRLKIAVKNSNMEFINKFYEYYVKYNKDSSTITHAEFKTKCVEDDAWFFSKFLGCELIDIIKSEHIEDDFVTSCIAYASSSTDLSAPFIKLE